MHVHPTALADVLLLEPRVFRDARGQFMETWNATRFAALGIAAAFVQENQSRSLRHVLRGLHYQIEHAQGKLVRVVRGAVHDVVVDMRRSSPQFGQHAAIELSEANCRMLWVPPGFAHGFLVTSGIADVVYMVTDIYAPQHERTLLWNDPALAIDWPLGDAAPLLSDKDAIGLPLAQADTFR
jgi:dTDP-4-dehydrorhamnose 3,5-epimerase